MWPLTLYRMWLGERVVEGMAMYTCVPCASPLLHAQKIHRVASNNPDSLPLMILCAHLRNSKGFKNLGLQDYLRAYKRIPECRLINLCIGAGGSGWSTRRRSGGEFSAAGDRIMRSSHTLTGVSYSSAAMNRNRKDRHAAVIRAFAFIMRYYELSKRTRRSAYNVARAFHHLKLYHKAIPFYRAVLRIDGAKNPLKDDAYETPSSLLALTRCAAHNLVLLYKASGAIELARHILQEFLVW